MSDISWAQNVEDADIIGFQGYLPTLMTVFGLTQADVGKLLGLSHVTVSNIICWKRSVILRPSEYVHLRLWMQAKPDKNQLQRDALHYMTYKPPYGAKVQKKIDDIVSFVSNEKARCGFGIKKSVLADKIGKAWEEKE